MSQLRVLVAQQNYTVGAIEANTAQIIEVIEHHQARHSDALPVDIVVFSELSITGYFPQDWLFRDDFQKRVDKALEKIQTATRHLYVMVGHPRYKENDNSQSGKRFNSVSIFHEGKVIAQYDKQLLPNYGVFDEKRYFDPGNNACVFLVKDQPIGVLICEDLWQSGPWKKLVDQNAKLIIALNASPFHEQKYREREKIVQERQKDEGAVPLIYANAVGGQDELIFDGQSFAMNQAGIVCARAKAYVPDMMTVDIEIGKSITLQKNPMMPLLSSEASLYQALVLGTRDYIKKNGFKKVLIGLSGGIDSALTLAIAVDALGAECVEAVMMPSRYTAPMSREDAILEIKALGINFREISIEPIFETLFARVGVTQNKVTLENLQARCRGILLMALSNETGSLVLTTSNKSEMAVGYCTLYGDMCGGFAVLKDVLKTKVYQLAHYRNSLSNEPVIPLRVIERAPSAELAFDQTDQDSLPPYDILDSILVQYMEENKSIEDIIASGIEANMVYSIRRLLHLNEYKRGQAPPGPKVTPRAFGGDWRYPITHGFYPIIE